jgi:hypothetical protein
VLGITPRGRIGAGAAALLESRAIFKEHRTVPLRGQATLPDLDER